MQISRDNGLSSVITMTVVYNPRGSSMRVEGLADNEIAGLFRHAADELDEHTMTNDAAA